MEQFFNSIVLIFIKEEIENEKLDTCNEYRQKMY